MTRPPLAGLRFHHIGYTSQHIEIEGLLRQHARLVRLPLPTVAFSGRRIAFQMLPNRLLIELIESGESHER